MNSREKQKKAHEAPLHMLDTEYRTRGCRHTNPDICSSAYITDICAFCRSDEMCLSPSRSWKKKYDELKKKEVGVEKGE